MKSIAIVYRPLNLWEQLVQILTIDQATARALSLSSTPFRIRFQPRRRFELVNQIPIRRASGAQVYSQWCSVLVHVGGTFVNVMEKLFLVRPEFISVFGKAWWVTRVSGGFTHKL